MVTPPWPLPIVCGPPVRKIWDRSGPVRKQVNLGASLGCLSILEMSRVWRLRPAWAKSRLMWCARVESFRMSFWSICRKSFTLTSGIICRSSCLNGTPVVSMFRIMCSRCCRSPSSSILSSLNES